MFETNDTLNLVRFVSRERDKTCLSNVTGRVTDVTGRHSNVTGRVSQT